MSKNRLYALLAAFCAILLAADAAHMEGGGVMLLGARTMWRGGKKLPYDAEVEYIQSTGTEYIDIVVNAKANKYFGVSGYAKTKSFNPTRNMVWASNVGRQFESSFYNVRNSITTYGSFVGSNATAGGWSNTNDDDIKYFEVSTTGRTVGGVFTTLTRSITQDFSTLRLFKGFLGVSEFAGGYPFAVRSFKIIVDESTVFDTYAVRFTNELGQTEGAMYDRVSGQLFGNAGTGAFVIGPDKTT